MEDNKGEDIGSEQQTGRLPAWQGQKQARKTTFLPACLDKNFQLIRQRKPVPRL